MPRQRPIDERIEEQEKHTNLLKQQRRVENEQKKLKEMRLTVRKNKRK